MGDVGPGRTDGNKSAVGWEGDVCEGERLKIRPGSDGMEDVIGRIRYDLCYVSIQSCGYLCTRWIRDEPL